MLVILKFFSKIFIKSSIFTNIYYKYAKITFKNGIIIELICFSSVVLLIFDPKIYQTTMILTITIFIALLVALNFLLLKFSCNKTTTKKQKHLRKKPVVFASKVTKLPVPERLAPTGS